MRYLVVAFGATLALTAGCGSRRPVVSGVVTLDGQPLDNGTIQLVPVAGDGQTSAAILDAQGRYQMEASPTKMKVIISSSRVTGKRPAYEGVPDSPWIETRDEVLPPRYSDRNKTELTITIVPGENKEDFHLKTKP